MKTFYIPEPCHENWDRMSPQEQGRHCAVCSKVVVDFTKKTHTQIESILDTAEGRVCGNFNLTQLDQKAQRKVFLKPTNLFNRNWKYFALAFFGFFSLSKKAEAQKMKGRVMLRGDVAPMNYHNNNTDTSKLQGSIKNNLGETVSGAMVIVESGEKEIARTTSLANGRYVIKLAPGLIFNNNISVTIHHEGYNSKYVHDLSIVKENTTLDVVMEEAYMMMGIVAYSNPIDSTMLEIDTFATIKDSTSSTILPEVEDTTVHQTTCTETFNNQENETDPEDKTVETPQTNLVIRPEDVESIVFPNPTNTNTTIYCNKVDTYTITVYDAKGGLVHSEKFNGSKKELNVTGFENGTYVITVNGTNNNNSTLKLIKQ